MGRDSFADTQTCLPRREARALSRARAASPALALLALLVPAPCLAQSTVTAETQVALLEPGSVVKVADMEFGQIAQPSAAGTVVLTPTPSPTCAVTGGLVRTGACRAAEFSVRERRNGRVTIREQNGGVVTLTGPGGATMQLTDFTIDVSDMTPIPGGNGANSLGRYRVTSSSGIANFRVGGTLRVAAAQAPGLYVGTLNIRVQFN